MSGQTKKVKKPSSGLKKSRRAKSEIRRLRMKIARWDKYTAQVEAGKRKGKASRWKTDGLLKHIQLLESVK
jgi:hypothetical protein